MRESGLADGQERFLDTGCLFSSPLSSSFREPPHLTSIVRLNAA